MEYTLWTGGSYTWIPRIRWAGQVLCSNISLSMFFLAISLTTLSRAHGRNGLPASGAGPADQSVWRVDLHSYGYDGYKPSREFRTAGTLHPLCFLTDGTLVASFLRHDSAPALVPRDGKNEHPLKLHSIFLSPQVGRVRATRAWATPHPYVDVFAAHDGQFVVLLPGKLTLYSPDLEPTRELSIPVPAPPASLAGVDSSPQGGSVLLTEIGINSTSYWIGTDGLRVLRSWRDSLGVSSASDRHVAFRREYLTQNGFVGEVRLRDPSGTERLVCRGSLGADCGPAQFVSDDILAVVQPHDFRLIRIDGEKLFAEHLREEDWLGQRRVAVSADGTRVALTAWAHKGGNAFFDIGWRAVLKRVMVFDVRSRSWAATLEGSKWKLGYEDLLGIALSPDGSLLALMDATGIVRVYRLPMTASDPDGRAGDRAKGGGSTR